MLSRAVFRSSSRVLRAPATSSPLAYRTYATAASSQNSRPPVEVYGVDGTYASALYTAAVKTSTLDPVAKGLANLHTAFEKDPKLAVILQAPTLSASDKSQIIEQLLKTAGTTDATLKNFLNTLSENNRLPYLGGVCGKFAELMSAAKGEVELRVTSAAALDQKVLKQIEAAVSKSPYVGEGRKIKVVPVVQPDIRGGLVVEIGDRTIDLSVSSKMAKMNKLLNEAL